MGVRIIADASNAVIYCSTEDVAFGPVFYGADAEEQAQDFLAWLPEDARRYNRADLIDRHSEWHKLAFRGSNEVQDIFTPVSERVSS